MIEDKPNKIQTTLRMDASLHDQLSEFVHEAGRKLPRRLRPSLDSTIQQAIRSFLTRRPEAGLDATRGELEGQKDSVLSVVNESRRGITPLHLNADEAEWVETLLIVLRSQNHGAITAVTENLKIFRRFVDLDEREKKDPSNQDGSPEPSRTGIGGGRVARAHNPAKGSASRKNDGIGAGDPSRRAPGAGGSTGGRK